jgi:hypothetical protein
LPGAVRKRLDVDVVVREMRKRSGSLHSAALRSK